MGEGRVTESTFVVRNVNLQSYLIIFNHIRSIRDFGSRPQGPEALGLISGVFRQTGIGYSHRCFPALILVFSDWPRFFR